MMKSVIVGAAAVTAMNATEHDAGRMEMVRKINNLPGMTWKAGINEKFKGQPLGASKSLLGVKYDDFQQRAQHIRDGKIVVVDAPEDFVAADEFDSETNWPKCAKVIDDIRDQSNCGCCWAFGGASAASDRMCIASDGKVAAPISANDVCFGASRNGCGGGYLQATWQYIHKGAVSGGIQGDTGPLGGGFCSKFPMPHCHHHGPQGDDPYPAEGQPGCPSQQSPAAPSKCDDDAKAPYNDFSNKYKFDGRVESYGNEKAIQAAIQAAGPIETAFTVYEDFENYAGGVYQPTSNKVLGGHAVRIVGWGEDSGTKYWKVANSWNPHWGEKGYFRIIRGTDACSIESQGMASSAKATWSGPGF